MAQQGDRNPTPFYVPSPPLSLSLSFSLSPSLPLSLSDSEVAIETKYVHSGGGVTGWARNERKTLMAQYYCAPRLLPLNKAHSPHPSVRSFRPLSRAFSAEYMAYFVLGPRPSSARPSEWRLRPAWSLLAFDGLPSLPLSILPSFDFVSLPSPSEFWTKAAASFIPSSLAPSPLLAVSPSGQSAQQRQPAFLGNDLPPPPPLQQRRYSLAQSDLTRLAP